MFFLCSASVQDVTKSPLFTQQAEKKLVDVVIAPVKIILPQGATNVVFLAQKEALSKRKKAVLHVVIACIESDPKGLFARFSVSSLLQSLQGRNPEPSGKCEHRK